jgi:hypothetical protein
MFRPNKEATNPKKINLPNILNFIQAMIRFYLLKKGVMPMAKADRTAQIVAQRTEGVQKNSPKCLEKGWCIHCGCDMPEKLYEPAACEYGCYPAWPKEDK